jgi:catechol 2,3-dioxygenase-like lactoylglutathione lyase family enzyme
MRLALICAALAAFGAPVLAQVLTPNSTGVSMGHLHVNSADPEKQRKFWVDLLGAKPAKLGALDVYTMPGVIVMVAKKPQVAEPTEGSAVNHLGVTVKDFEASMAKVKAAGIQFTQPSQTQMMLAGPEGLKVEITKNAEQPAPLMHHHVHFATPDVPAIQKWYADMFGAIPGKRGRFDAADLPGVNLSFTKSDGKTAGTKGRALDHIGFEVRNLEAFTKKLEAAGVKFDVPYRKVPSLNIAIAFFTDPWGTYIELTEGLAQVK